MRLLLLFFFIFKPVYALSPHIDESGVSNFVEVIRTISSVDDVCVEDTGVECAQYFSQLGPSVLRFFVESVNKDNRTYLDIKLRGQCIQAAALIENSEVVQIKNNQLDENFSAVADIYIDGVELLRKCERKRLPSSQN